MGYVVCVKRKNTPTINAIICEKKCDEKDRCSAYLGYLKGAKKPALTAEKHPSH